MTETERILYERQYLIDCLRQVLRDHGDPHPRNASLAGLRASNDATDAMICRVFNKLKIPIGYESDDELDAEEVFGKL
jgi:hypothetical protein